MVCCLSFIPAHAWFVEDIIAIDQSKENNSQKIVKFFVLKKEIYIEQEKTTSERKLNDLAFAQKLLNKKIIYYTNLSKNKKYMRIAHAWGDYKWFTYTNSLDALEQNKKYFRYFELDFSWTKDNKLVCIHDWGGSFKKSFWFSLEGKVPTKKQFMYYVIKNKSYKNCTLDSLVVWLEKNPTVFIITDVKWGNFDAIDEIARLYPDQKNRFIPQIHNPNDYKGVKEMWFTKIIWTLYEYQWKKQDILQYAKKYNFFAITMPKEKVKTWLALELKTLWERVYAHTVNNFEEFKKLQLLWVDEVYTDSLTRYE